VTAEGLLLLLLLGQSWVATGLAHHALLMPHALLLHWGGDPQVGHHACGLQQQQQQAVLLLLHGDARTLAWQQQQEQQQPRGPIALGIDLPVKKAGSLCLGATVLLLAGV
jgi:hypothetical protein